MTTISENPQIVSDAVAALDIRAQMFVDGAYVDAVSGETFDDYLDRRIFQPRDLCAFEDGCLLRSDVRREKQEPIVGVIGRQLRSASVQLLDHDSYVLP